MLTVILVMNALHYACNCILVLAFMYTILCKTLGPPVLREIKLKEVNTKAYNDEHNI